MLLLASYRAFLKDRSTVFAMAADLFAISGVIFLGWDPYRLAGFYWLDLSVGFYLFLAYSYLYRSGNPLMLSLLTTAFSMLFMSVILYGYLHVILSFPRELNPHAAYLKPHQVFHPFYDIGVFLVLSVMSHVFRNRKLAGVPRRNVIYHRLIYLIAGLCILPVIFLVAGYLSLAFGHFKIWLIFSLVFFRNIIEYWRFRNAQALVTASPVQA